jgi:methyl coenzyme M reductase subunit D
MRVGAVVVQIDMLQILRHGSKRLPAGFWLHNGHFLKTKYDVTDLGHVLIQGSRLVEP